MPKILSLRDWLHVHRVKVSTLAGAAGVSLSHISKLSNGKTGISQDVAARIYAVTREMHPPGAWEDRWGTRPRISSTK